MEEGQLKNSLQLLWVERYLAENGDLVESPEGFLYLDGYGRLIDSKTEKEADEQRCKVRDAKHTARYGQIGKRVSNRSDALLRT
jgi:hypothetical protein